MRTLSAASVLALAAPRVRLAFARGTELCALSATVVVTVAWFFHHATDPLKFSF